MVTSTPSRRDEALMPEKGGPEREPLTLFGRLSMRATPPGCGDLDRVDRERECANQQLTAARMAACREAQLAHEKLARAHDDLAAELARSASQRSKWHDD